MKIGKIFIIPIFVVMLLAPLFFAKAEICSWGFSEKTTQYAPNPLGGVGQTVTFTTARCPENATQTSEKYCNATDKGEYPPSSGKTAICCCSPDPVITGKKPEFKIPELQISLGETFAKPDCKPNGDGKYVCEISWLGEYITLLYNYALKIGGILAAIMLMAGGALWLVSAGEANRISQAKDLISGSLIGLGILFSSFLILYQINPNLIKIKAITIGGVTGKDIDLILKNKDGGIAQTYAGTCATAEELTNGVSFYATGYCKPTWEDTEKFYCFVAMNCSCPPCTAEAIKDGSCKQTSTGGRDPRKNCDKWFGKNHPNYQPCAAFTSDINYCNKTGNGSAPIAGSTIAGPINCAGMGYGNTICATSSDGTKKTYTITDTGSAITGKRIDIWTGSDCSKANQVTGVVNVKAGACTP